MLQQFEGGCHCDRVRFRVTADLALVTQCNCPMSVRCLDGVDPVTLAPKPFDGRNWEAAITQDPPWRGRG